MGTDSNLPVHARYRVCNGRVEFDVKGEREKVLVVIDDNEVRIHQSAGVDVVCIVDGENVELPDDWTGRLPFQTTHAMPIEVRFSELFDEDAGQHKSNVVLAPGIHVEEETTTTQVGRTDPIEEQCGCGYCHGPPMAYIGVGCTCTEACKNSRQAQTLVTTGEGEQEC